MFCGLPDHSGSRHKYKVGHLNRLPISSGLLIVRSFKDMELRYCSHSVSLNLAYIIYYIIGLGLLGGSFEGDLRYWFWSDGILSLKVDRILVVPIPWTLDDYFLGNQVSLKSR